MDAVSDVPNCPVSRQGVLTLNTGFLGRQPARTESSRGATLKREHRGIPLKSSYDVLRLKWQANCVVCTLPHESALVSKTRS